MFFNPMVTCSTVTPNGKTLYVIDPEATQMAFQNLANESATAEGRFNTLEKRMTELESFTKFCAQHYPEVVNEFVLATMAKERFDVKGKGVKP
jgi:hypothetical protein